MDHPANGRLSGHVHRHLQGAAQSPRVCSRVCMSNRHIRSRLDCCLLRSVLRGAAVARSRRR